MSQIKSPQEMAGPLADDLVVEMLDKHLPEGLSARKSSYEEDSGLDQIVKGKKVDVVVNLDEHPAMVMQVTVGESRETKDEKLELMRREPFVRLPEMNPSDVALPRVLVKLPAEEVLNFTGDSSKNEVEGTIWNKIVDGTLLSLQFDLLKTKNPKEQKHIKILMDIFKSKNPS